MSRFRKNSFNVVHASEIKGARFLRVGYDFISKTATSAKQLRKEIAEAVVGLGQLPRRNKLGQDTIAAPGGRFCIMHETTYGHRS